MKASEFLPRYGVSANFCILRKQKESRRLLVLAVASDGFESNSGVDGMTSGLLGDSSNRDVSESSVFGEMQPYGNISSWFWGQSNRGLSKRLTESAILQPFYRARASRLQVWFPNLRLRTYLDLVSVRGRILNFV